MVQDVGLGRLIVQHVGPQTCEFLTSAKVNLGHGILHQGIPQYASHFRLALSTHQNDVKKFNSHQLVYCFWHFHKTSTKQLGAKGLIWLRVPNTSTVKRSQGRNLAAEPKHRWGGSLLPGPLLVACSGFFFYKT